MGVDEWSRVEVKVKPVALVLLAAREGGGGGLGRMFGCGSAYKHRLKTQS